MTNIKEKTENVPEENMAEFDFATAARWLKEKEGENAERKVAEILKDEFGEWRLENISEEIWKLIIWR